LSKPLDQLVASQAGVSQAQLEVAFLELPELEKELVAARFGQPSPLEIPSVRNFSERPGSFVTPIPITPLHPPGSDLPKSEQ